MFQTIISCLNHAFKVLNGMADSTKRNWRDYKFDINDKEKDNNSNYLFQASMLIFP